MHRRALLLPLLMLAFVRADAGAISEKADFVSDIQLIVSSEDSDRQDEAPRLPPPAPERRAQREKLSSEIAALEQQLKAGSADFDAEQHTWEAEMVRSIDWQPLSVTNVKVDGGANLKIEVDGTLTASGRAAHTDTFTVTARTNLRGITALRIELLPDAAAAGEAVLSELRVTAGPRVDVPNPNTAPALERQSPVTLQNASSDVETADTDISRIIDGNDDTRWTFPLVKSGSHFVVVEAAEPVSTADGSDTELLFRIAQNHGEHGTLSRFKLAATTSPHPVRQLSPALRAILAIEPSERSEAQRKQISDAFRPLSKSAHNINAEINEKKEELAKIKAVELPVVRGRPRDQRRKSP